MKTKTIILICLLLTSIAAQAALPQGKWTVTQVTIEKNTDGDIQTTVYNTAAEVKSYILCPQKWEIDAQTIVQHYPGGWEETAGYTIKGNQLTIMAAGNAQLYQYSISGGNLILTATYDYVNNLPTGYTERINEKWTITLKK